MGVAVGWVDEEGMRQRETAAIALVLALSVLNSLDAAFTAVFVRQGLATEANPLMAVLLASSPALFVTVKLALVNGGALCLWMLRRTAMAGVALRASVVAYAMVVAWHLLFVGRSAL